VDDEPQPVARRLVHHHLLDDRADYLLLQLDGTGGALPYRREAFAERE